MLECGFHRAKKNFKLLIGPGKIKTRLQQLTVVNVGSCNQVPATSSKCHQSGISGCHSDSLSQTLGLSGLCLFVAYCNNATGIET